MSKKIVRSTRNVTDITKLSSNLLEENDIVSTQEGQVYIVTKNGLKPIYQDDTIDQLKKDITTLKTKNTNLEKRVKNLENS